MWFANVYLEKTQAFAFYSVVDTNILYVQVTKRNSRGLKDYLWRTASLKYAAALSSQIYPKDRNVLLKIFSKPTSALSLKREEETDALVQQLP